jgi:hypothetical protein
MSQAVATYDASVASHSCTEEYNSKVKSRNSKRQLINNYNL